MRELLLNSTQSAYQRGTASCSFQADVGCEASGGGGEDTGAAGQTFKTSDKLMFRSKVWGKPTHVGGRGSQL